MRVTWYLFGVFIILTLGDVYVVNTNDIEAGVVRAPAISRDSVVVARFKRHDKLSSKKDGHDKKFVLKETILAFKKAIGKKKVAINAAIQKKKAAAKQYMQKKINLMLAKKKKFVSYLSTKWAKIRTTLKEKYNKMSKQWKHPVKT